MSQSDRDGDKDGAESVTSTNPTVTADDAETLGIMTMLRKHDATIKAMSQDVEVLRHSGCVMEQRLQAYHKYMVDFMGKRCPDGYRNMEWTPIITVLDESQKLKGSAEADNDNNQGAAGKKKGGKKRRRAVLSDGDEDETTEPVPPPKPKPLAVNYDVALSSDTSKRSLYGLKGSAGYCLIYNVGDSYFDFPPKVVSEKTTKALKAAGIHSLKEVLASEEHHETCMMAFVTGLLHHETELFVKRRPLFLECAVDTDDLQRQPDVIANVQPEPLRSALMLVLSKWNVQPTENVAKVFLRIVKAADGFLAKIRNYQPAADFRRKQTDAAGGAGNTIAENESDSNASSAND